MSGFIANELSALLRRARDLLRECDPIAAALDGAHTGSAYRAALAAAGAAVVDSASTPSARVITEIG